MNNNDFYEKEIRCRTCSSKYTVKIPLNHKLEIFEIEEKSIFSDIIYYTVLGRFIIPTKSPKVTLYERVRIFKQRYRDVIPTDAKEVICPYCGDGLHYKDYKWHFTHDC